MTKVSADLPSALVRLAQRASHMPDFFGFLLSAFQQKEDLTTNKLTKFLGVRPQLLPRLALCRRPKSDSPDLADQISEIARFTETSPDILLTVLRRVEALEALAAHNKIVPIDEAKAKSTREGQPGLLAAARDCEPKSRSRSRKKSAPSKEK
jgi:hypothetical protein